MLSIVVSNKCLHYVIVSRIHKNGIGWMEKTYNW